MDTEGSTYQFALISASQTKSLRLMCKKRAERPARFQWFALLRAQIAKNLAGLHTFAR